MTEYNLIISYKGPPPEMKQKARYASSGRFSKEFNMDIPYIVAKTLYLVPERVHLFSISITRPDPLEDPSGIPLFEYDDLDTIEPLFHLGLIPAYKKLEKLSVDRDLEKEFLQEILVQLALVNLYRTATRIRLHKDF